MLTNSRSLRQYHELLTASLNTIDPNSIELLISKLSEIEKSKKRVFLCGNGGSAATAEHFAVDIGIGSQLRNSGVRTVSLVSNLASITALGNDVGYNSVFSSQIALEAEPEDVLIIFSASGNSENLLEALSQARKMGLFCIGFLGFDGGKLLNKVDLALHVRTDQGEYGIVEDIHLSICHYVTERVRGNSNS